MTENQDHLASLPLLRIPLEKLFSMVDVRMSNPWNIGHLTAEDILQYKPGKQAPPMEFEWHPEAWDYQWTREDHIHHIWRMVNQNNGESLPPISLDVGEAGRDAGWPIVDGHHRILAAWVRGDDHIQARVDGSQAFIFRAFGDIEQVPRVNTARRTPGR